MKAQDILRQSAQHIDDRAATRDQAEGERSMARTVAAFNALTGHALTERDGWLFMVALKAARATNTPTGIPDDYQDGAAYFALAGECVAGNDNAIPVEAERSAQGNTIIIEGVGEVCIPSGYNWVAKDADGRWWFYEQEPIAGVAQWIISEGSTSHAGTGNPSGDWKTTAHKVGE